MLVKLVCYNIQHGFHSRKEDGPIKVYDSRIRDTMEVVQAMDPDILMLTEICDSRWNDHGVNVDYKSLFGFSNYIADFPFDGDSHGNAILSNFVLSKEKSLCRKSLKHARATAYVRGIELMIDVFHPHPRISEDERADFVRRIIQKPGKLHILAGDFNAYSPDDIYDRDSMIKSYRQFLDNPKDAERKVDELLTYKSINAIKDSGLIDSYRKINKGVQERSVPSILRDGGDKGARMDYIFCSDDIEIKDAGIYNKSPAGTASDHFPVYAVIEV